MGSDNTSKQTGPAANTQQSSTRPASNSSKKRRATRGGSAPQVGGTAVPGAKSTQPKQIPTTNDPNEQQLASYSRTMRRRMEQMGMVQSTDDRLRRVQEQRKKRAARRKERLDTRRREALKSAPKVDLKLGRRNLYFIIAVAVVIILLIAFAFLRANHII
jgi:DNA mismatch repair ATPase MutL